MGENRRINVGLFLGNLEDEFDCAIARGAIKGSKDMDVNLIIFHGKYIKAEYEDKEITQYEYQKNTVYYYASKENIDVLIVVLGTIGTLMTEREKQEFFAHFEGIPILLIASEMEGYPSILFDNASGIKEGIHHMVNDHKREQIGFVSGPITNTDAKERLDAYKEALEELGIPYDDKKVVYGNFSRYSERVVEALLEENPDLDGIVFANDQMALGGYVVLKKHNIMVGEDISVMGFDDSPLSITLSPSLTSVRADAMQIGRTAVHEAIHLYQDGECDIERVSTFLVRRASCGCDAISITSWEHGNLAEIVQHGEEENISWEFVNSYLPDKNSKNNMYQKAREAMYMFVKTLIGFTCDAYYSTKDRKVIIAYFERMMNSYLMDFLETGEIVDFLDVLRMALVQDSSRDESEIKEIFLAIYRQIASYASSGVKEYYYHVDWVNWITNSISRDMLVYETTDDRTYTSIMEKLKRLDITRSYLYVFDTPVRVLMDEGYKSFEKIESVNLKAYHDGKRADTVPVNKQRMTPYEILTHDFLPQDDAYAFVFSTLYANEEQYGLILCEMEPHYFGYLNALLNQVSAALKIMLLLKQRDAIQQRLEENLQFIKESNLVLEALSKSDELTGIYNRRGFFDLTSSMIRNKHNVGKHAIIVYADLDNLKQINDCFGHDDGDFALVSSTEILKDAFRSTDVVGRIGGDEFAVFAFVTGEGNCEVFYNRIKRLADEFNEKCGKEYNVCISVGIHEFVCGKNTSIEDNLEIADALLYADKRRKNKDARKNITE